MTDKILLPNIGWVIFHKDFVKIIREEEDNIYYITTTNNKEAKKGGFNERTVGVLKTKDNNYVVGVAVSSPYKKSTDRSGTRVVISRIKTFIDSDMESTPDTSGVTFVPESLQHLLTEDSNCYATLMGSIDEELLQNSVEALKKADEFFKNSQMSRMFTKRKKELSEK